MFFHCHVNSEKDLVLVSDKVSVTGLDHDTCHMISVFMQLEAGGSCMQLLPIIAQEVVDEFALRYAIEPIFRMMV